MKRTFAALLIALATFGTAWADRPADVKGWGRTTWGMSVAQVKALYPGMKPRGTLDGKKIFLLKGVAIRDGNAEVTLEFESHGGLVNVGVVVRDHRSLMALMDAIRDNFGRCDDDTPFDDVRHLMRWDFRSTTIHFMTESGDRASLGYKPTHGDNL